MADADGGEVDEGLGLGSIFTVRRESSLALYNSAKVLLLDRSYTHRTLFRRRRRKPGR
jgi:hypothetical protein